MDLKHMVLGEHREEIKEVATQRNAETIALVGSVARGEDTDASDFDFLVSFKPNACLLDHVGLEFDLEGILGRSVDVVGRGAITDRTRGMLDDAITL